MVMDAVAHWRHGRLGETATLVSAAASTKLAAGGASRTAGGAATGDFISAKGLTAFRELTRTAILPGYLAIAAFASAATATPSTTASAPAPALASIRTVTRNRPVAIGIGARRGGALCAISDVIAGNVVRTTALVDTPRRSERGLVTARSLVGSSLGTNTLGSFALTYP